MPINVAVEDHAFYIDIQSLKDFDSRCWDKRWMGNSTLPLFPTCSSKEIEYASGVDSSAYWEQSPAWPYSAMNQFIGNTKQPP